MEKAHLKNIVEAVLLAAESPLTVDGLLKLFDEPPSRGEVKDVLLALQSDYTGRGIELIEVSTGYRIQTRSQVSTWVSRLREEKPARYTRAFLETLALITYRQPVTRAEIEDIRGVSVNANIIRSLQDRNWVRVVGHKDVPGKPELLATTREFLDYFNLQSLEDLPSLMDIQDMEMVEAKAREIPGLFDQLPGESAQEDDGAPQAGGDADPALLEHADSKAVEISESEIIGESNQDGADRLEKTNTSIDAKILEDTQDSSALADTMIGNSEFVIAETLGSEFMESEAVEDDNIEDKAVEDEAVEDEAVEDKAVEDEAVEDEAFEDETVENDSARDPYFMTSSIEEVRHEKPMLNEHAAAGDGLFSAPITAEMGNGIVEPAAENEDISHEEQPDSTHAENTVTQQESIREFEPVDKDNDTVVRFSEYRNDIAESLTDTGLTTEPNGYGGQDESCQDHGMDYKQKHSGESSQDDNLQESDDPLNSQFREH